MLSNKCTVEHNILNGDSFSWSLLRCICAECVCILVSFTLKLTEFTYNSHNVENNRLAIVYSTPPPLPPTTCVVPARFWRTIIAIGIHELTFHTHTHFSFPILVIFGCHEANSEYMFGPCSMSFELSQTLSFMNEKNRRDTVIMSQYAMWPLANFGCTTKQKL